MQDSTSSKLAAFGEGHIVAHMQNAQRIGTVLLGIVVLVVLGKVLLDTVVILGMEAEGPMHSDAGSYVMVGRAILNGLKPYTDIFDAKPPGIYLLMAISLWLTNGEMFATWLQIVLLLGFPILISTYVILACEKQWHSARMWLIAGIGFIGGAVLMFYTEERSGALQPEGFGFFFSMVYAFVLLRTELRSRWSVGLASIAMLLSIGMKEPFVLANLAIALLLTPSWKGLLRTFFLPLGLAAVMGCIALGFLGLLWPYIGVHLPNMLIHRVQEVTEYSPLWLRPMRTGRIYGDIVQYYPSGKFTGWMIILLWMSTPLLLSQKQQSWKTVLSTWITMFPAMVTVNLVFLVLILKGMYPDAPVFTIIDQNFAAKEYAWIVATLVGCFALWRIDRTLLKRSVYTHAILYLTSLAIAAGVAYHPNFFIFAIPVYGTLLLLGMREAMAERLSPLMLVAIAGSVLLAGIFYYPNPKHVGGHADRLLSNYAHTRKDVERLDALLDACGIERANINVSTVSLSFSKHSPWGPLMGLSIPAYFPPDHPYGKRTVENILEHAEIMIFNEEEFYTRDLIKPILPLIKEQFTEEIPECAKPYLPYDDYKVLFRRHNKPQSPS